MIRETQLKPTSFLAHLSVQLLVAWMTVFAVGFAVPAKAVAQEIPVGWESYLSRPTIESVHARSHELGAMWEMLKAAHFSYVAELLGLYPDDAEIYFLARDGELLYDTARLMTQGTSRYARMHLLNISSKNVGDPRLRSYVEQGGITVESLAQGYDVVLVDTGFKGSIPKAIADLFPAALKKNFKVQLIVCETGEFPSARAFLAHVNPYVNNQNPRQMRATLAGSYEHLPRYTDRSTEFMEIDGVLQPLSRINEIGKGLDGQVSKEKSREMMEDIKAEWQKPATRLRAAGEQHQIEWLRRMFAENSEQARDEMKAKVEAQVEPYARMIIEAQVRDLLEARGNVNLTSNISLGDIGIGLHTPHVNRAKRNEVLKEHPEWALLFRSPTTMIPQLVSSGDWETLENLIRADIDGYTNDILAEAIENAPAGPKQELQLLMKKKPDDRPAVKKTYFTPQGSSCPNVAL